MWKLQGEQGICLMIEKRREVLLCNAGCDLRAVQSGVFHGCSPGLRWHSA